MTRIFGGEDRGMEGGGGSTVLSQKAELSLPMSIRARGLQCNEMSRVSHFILMMVQWGMVFDTM